MSWMQKALGLKKVVDQEKINRGSLRVQNVCIHGETDCVRCAAEDYETQSTSTQQVWQNLDDQDLRRVITALPTEVVEMLRRFPEEAVLAGGFIRAIVANEATRDIDIFVKSEKKAKDILVEVGLEFEKHELHCKAEKNGSEIQVIWRYEYKVPVDVPNEFDYTVCKACVYFDKGDGKKIEPGFRGVCHERFYRDLSRKELVYICDRDMEQSTGFPRLLKYTSYGYQIGPKSLAEVVTKLCLSLDFEKGFQGLLAQLEEAYKANGSDEKWLEMNKAYVKPKPKPRPKAHESYSYGS